MIDIVTVASFVLIAATMYSLAGGVRKLWQDPIKERLAIVASGARGTGQRSGTRDWLVENLAQHLPEFRSDHGGLAKELRRAGFYRPTAHKEYLALRNILVFAAALGTGIVAVALGPERQTLVRAVIVAGLVAVGLCWGLPRIYVSLAANRREERIRRALPNALDMIGMCLTGGMSLHKALAHVSHEIYFAHPDLAVELLIVRQQAEMTSLDLALGQFAERIDSPEVTSLATLIAQNQRLGTNVAGTVREFADDMRLKRRQLADEQSAKVGLRLLFPVVLCLLPSFFLILWGPALLELWNFFQEFEGVSPLNL